jgi:hypothetical protein
MSKRETIGEARERLRDASQRDPPRLLDRAVV